MAEAKKLRVTQMRSRYGRGVRHQACLRGLGLRRIHHTVEVEDTPAVRGMIGKISFMLKWEQV